MKKTKKCKKALFFNNNFVFLQQIPILKIYYE